MVNVNHIVFTVTIKIHFIILQNPEPPASSKVYSRTIPPQKLLATAPREAILGGEARPNIPAGAVPWHPCQEREHRCSLFVSFGSADQCGICGDEDRFWVEEGPEKALGGQTQRFSGPSRLLESRAVFLSATCRERHSEALSPAWPKRRISGRPFGNFPTEPPGTKRGSHAAPTFKLSIWTLPSTHTNLWKQRSLLSGQLAGGQPEPGRGQPDSPRFLLLPPLIICHANEKL